MTVTLEWEEHRVRRIQISDEDFEELKRIYIDDFTPDHSFDFNIESQRQFIVLLEGLHEDEEIDDQYRSIHSLSEVSANGKSHYFAHWTCDDEGDE